MILVLAVEFLARPQKQSINPPKRQTLAVFSSRGEPHTAVCQKWIRAHPKCNARYVIVPRNVRLTSLDSAQLFSCVRCLFTHVKLKTRTSHRRSFKVAFGFGGLCLQGRSHTPYVDVSRRCRSECSKHRCLKRSLKLQHMIMNIDETSYLSLSLYIYIYIHICNM